MTSLEQTFNSVIPSRSRCLNPQQRCREIKRVTEKRIHVLHYHFPRAACFSPITPPAMPSHPTPGSVTQPMSSAQSRGPWDSTGFGTGSADSRLHRFTAEPFEAKKTQRVLTRGGSKRRTQLCVGKLDSLSFA